MNEEGIIYYSRRNKEREGRHLLQATFQSRTSVDFATALPSTLRAFISYCLSYESCCPSTHTVQVLPKDQVNAAKHNNGIFPSVQSCKKRHKPRVEIL